MEGFICAVLIMSFMWAPWIFASRTITRWDFEAATKACQEANGVLENIDAGTFRNVVSCQNNANGETVTFYLDRIATKKTK